MARIKATVIGKPYRGVKVGGTVELPARDADILRRIGRVSIEGRGGTYRRRDMVAEGSDLDGMDRDQLRALADSMGLEVHHATGAPRLRQAIAAARRG